jgi:hypothetical protein
MLAPVQKPLAVRTALAVARVLGMDRLVSLDPDKLVAKAVAKARLEDFGADDGWRDALERACRSADEDARLSFLGRLGFRQRLIAILENRLLRHATPIPDTILARPLIVSGMPRSGTTYLHRLLASVPGTRPLKFWELQRPFAPLVGSDRRRAEIVRGMNAIRRSAPDFDAKHFMDVDEPEECMFLLDDTFRSLSFYVMAPLYGYREWLVDQDMTEPYRTYRSHLQHFQAQSPDLRLTLKAPIHTAYLDTLVSVVPEAVHVQTHRDPIAVLASANSLFLTVHSMVSEELDVPRMVATNVATMEMFSRKSIAMRERIAPKVVLDVQYDDLCRDPIGVVRGIHTHFDLPFDAEAEARVRAYAESHPQGYKGVHRYKAEDLGIDLDELRDRFRPYTERFVAA